MASPQYASVVPETRLAAAVVNQFRTRDIFEIGKPHQFYKIDSHSFRTNDLDFRVMVLGPAEEVSFLRTEQMDPGYSSGMNTSPRSIPIVHGKPRFDKVDGKLVSGFHSPFCSNDVRLDRRRICRVAQYAWEMAKVVRDADRWKIFLTAMTMMEFAMVLEWASVKAAKGNLPNRWVPKSVVLHEIKPDIDRFMATEKIYRTGKEGELFRGADVYGVIPLYRRFSGRFIWYGYDYNNEEFRLTPSFVVTRTNAGWSLYLMADGYGSEHICTGKGDPAKCEQKILEKAKALVMTALMDSDSIKSHILRMVFNKSKGCKIVHLQAVKYSKDETLAFYTTVMSHYHQWMRASFEYDCESMIPYYFDRNGEGYAAARKAAKAIANVYHYFYGEQHEPTGN